MWVLLAIPALFALGTGAWLLLRPARLRVPWTDALPGSREAATVLRHAQQEEWTTGFRAPIHRATGLLATPWNDAGQHRPSEAAGRFCARCQHLIPLAIWDTHRCDDLARLAKELGS